LRIRPLLTLDDGKIVSYGKVIGWERLRRAVMEMIARELEGRTPAMMGVATAADPALRESLAGEVRERFSPRDFLSGPVGALIGIHAGPGAWGVFYLP
jgi:fatty acid-binding protein DegV